MSPDGHTLASGSIDNTIRLWDLDLDRVRAKACDHLTRNLSAYEWQRFFGDEDPVKTCPNRPIHPSFFAPGDRHANEGRIDEAIAEYQRVLTAFGSREIDPQARARQITASTRLRSALDLARAGKLTGALNAYVWALPVDPELLGATGVENALCWHGALGGQAAAVLVICELAVALSPGDGNRIESLEQGKNPFDAATLEALRRDEP